MNCDKRIGEKVHYVARGSADGVYPPICRCAFVVGVRESSDGHGEHHDLCVLNPEGLFFNKGVVFDQSGKAPGTWHYIEADW
jgi:hypothetical protein